VGPADTRVVLIVDDEHAIVEALSELLSWEGYVVRAASNGRAALELLRAERIDVVLLDVMMSEMDGLQTAAAIRQDEALGHVRIVLMSAATIPATDAPSWDAALQKPFDLETLRGTLAAVLAAVSRGAGGP